MAALGRVTPDDEIWPADVAIPFDARGRRNPSGLGPPGGLGDTLANFRNGVVSFRPRRQNCIHGLSSDRVLKASHNQIILRLAIYVLLS